MKFAQIAEDAEEFETAAGIAETATRLRTANRTWHGIFAVKNVGSSVLQLAIDSQTVVQKNSLFINGHPSNLGVLQFANFALMVLNVGDFANAAYAWRRASSLRKELDHDLALGRLTEFVNRRPPENPEDLDGVRGSEQAGYSTSQIGHDTGPPSPAESSLHVLNSGPPSPADSALSLLLKKTPTPSLAASAVSHDLEGAAPGSSRLVWRTGEQIYQDVFENMLPGDPISGPSQVVSRERTRRRV
jgi:hypothetical protein